MILIFTRFVLDWVDHFIRIAVKVPHNLHMIQLVPENFRRGFFHFIFA